MAYGSKNNRKKILSSIVEGADGGSLMGALQASMREEDNRSRGRGAVSAAKSLEDTYENVSSMKRSLGAKQQATNEAINKSRSSDSSIAKDWMTVLSVQAEADKPANDIKRSEMLARRMADPQTDDDIYLVTGKPPPVKKVAEPDAITDALREALGEDEKEGPLSPDDMAITKANTDFPSRIDMDLNDNTENKSTFPARPPLDLKEEGLMSRPKTRPESSMFFGTESTKLEFGQKALQDLGFYKSKVDGKKGANTSNAIKTFQHSNGLPVTGILDEDTKIKLSSTSDLVSQPSPQTTILSFISEGEGGYGAANNGTSSLSTKFSVSDGYYSDTYNKPLTEMSVNELMNAQVGTTGLTTEELLKLDPESTDAQKNRDVFAVGAYQIIPKTMWSAVRQGSIDPDSVFGPAVQDKIAMDFLVGSDRPKLKGFLDGNPNISVEDAMLDFAKQFASVPNPKTGKSYYGKGNKAHHTKAETKAMLLQARDENTL